MIIITTHRESDFDALASLVAASLLYPDAKCVLPTSVNPNLKPFLAIHKDFFNLYSPPDIVLEDVTTLVVVDTHSWNRLEGMEPLKDRQDLKIIVWDHHLHGDMKTPHKHVKEAGASVTLLIHEIERQRKLITPIQATLFLMGLYEDTGNLTFASTLAQDAYAAGFLLDRRADLQILSTFLRQAYGKKQKDTLFQMIQEAQRIDIGGFSVSIAKMEIQGRIQNLAMVIEMYREILNVDAAFGIFKDVEKNKCVVIGRSNIDDIDIGLLMKSIGGGGHPGAGSALLKQVNPDTIEEMLVELISGNQQSSVILSDIMSYPVITINEDTTIESAAMLLRDLGYTGMPVVDKNGHIQGVISRRDFKKLRKTKQMQSPVKAFMSRNVVTISYDKSILEVVRLMIKHDIGRIPVIKEEEIVGIITRSDTMAYFYDLLPD